MNRLKKPRYTWIALSLAGALVILGAAVVVRAADQRARRNEPLPQQVHRLLATGNLAAALALTAEISRLERTEVAATFAQWAAGQKASTRAEAERMAEAYLAAAELDLQRTDVYVGLADLVRAFRLSSQARRGFSIWIEAFGADPSRLGHPEFAVGESLDRLADLFEAVDAADRNPLDPAASLEAARQHLQSGNAAEARRYAAQARELAPRRLDVLSLLADLGLLEPLSAEPVLDITLPIHGGVLVDVRGGKAAIAGLSGEVTTAYVIALPGGKVEASIERCTGLTISPCGRFAAYAIEADAGKLWPIRVIDLQTKKTRLLLETAGPERGIAWSPDGSHIAVSSMEGLILVRPDGKDRRVVMPSSRTGSQIDHATWAWPQWFAGGAKVSAQLLGWEWLGEVQAYDLATRTTSVVLSRGSGPYDVGTVIWAPDGERMALNYRPGVYWTVAIARSGEDANQSEAAVAGEIDAEPVAWSPDGRQLLFRMGEHTWLWDNDTLEVSLLPGYPYFYSVWADDGIIYFLSASDAGKRLVGIRIIGGS